MFTIVLIALLCFTTTAKPPNPPSSSKVEALTQAGHRLSYILDTKNYSALNSVLANDVVLDATDLLPLTGGVAKGFDEVVSTFKRSGAGAKTAHRITNVLLLDEITPGKSRVNS